MAGNMMNGENGVDLDQVGCEAGERLPDHTSTGLTANEKPAPPVATRVM